MSSVSSASHPLPVPSAASRNALALAAVTMGNVIWGFTFLFTRVALRTTDPAVMLSLRFVVAFLLLNVLLLTGHEKVSFRGKNPKGILALTVTEIAYFYFESYGVLYTNATFSGMVLAVSPIVAIVLAMVFLKEYPTRRQALFCVLPVVGVMLIVSAGKTLGVITPIGALFLLCSCLTSGAYKTANRKAAEEFSPFERTYVMIGGCALVFTAAALFTTRGGMRPSGCPPCTPPPPWPVFWLWPVWAPSPPICWSTTPPGFSPWSRYPPLPPCVLWSPWWPAF